MIKNILLIGFGGFVGSVARYFVSKLNLHVDILSIPVGTLIVNVVGSLLIGFLIGIVVTIIVLVLGRSGVIPIKLCKLVCGC